MILVDMHTHSTYSADGESPLADMVGAARSLGLKYFGTAEHFDFDYIALGLRYEDGSLPHTDAAGYFSAARALQGRNGGGFEYLAGCEFGYTDDAAACERYVAVVAEYSPDFIVNSVHTCDGADSWYASYFNGRDKQSAYSSYLKRVKRSLSAPYDYDIVAHVGYVSRNAPYPDPKLRYVEFKDLYDDILREIIARGKILEVNSSSRGAGSSFLPDADVLAAYRALGGRKVCFASDAHSVGRIALNGAEAAELLKSLGFEYLTVPCRGRHIEVEI